MSPPTDTVTDAAVIPAPAEAPPKIIDPRFRDRRIAVLREQGRRRLRMLLAMVAVATAVGGGVLATESPLLDVDRITVVGASHTPPNLIAAATHVRRGAPLVWTDRRKVARRIAGLPWIASEHVAIHLPGELRIVVTERNPVAYASRVDGAFALVDATARILDIVPTRPTNLPEVVGAGPPPVPAETLDAARPALVLIAALGDLAARTPAIDVTTGAIAHMVDAGEVRFGAVEDVSAKVAALRAVLASLGGRHVGYIDVRVPDAPVVGG